ncbi:magnesium protoporphyrin IX methyltransferase [Picosynechococcus sp. PCC 11901]|uniref:magnesium protoporphyrin IX methyltransferase n=1 Tax=unclassified Picosynechococcus TaxID=3079910 RepID=UPI0004AA8C12|nr:MULTISPECIES: magnesium protoporphyrin IX methyltransferase [unclassified Picosynechococcus]QCS49505.1 magnesium protoporphyrin IX methyltransferase [Picosynechococcus sp. PCC 11901]
MTSSLNDKTIVKDYFNAKGFDRWRRIYGDGDVNKVQADIRVGHQQTIDKVVAWLKADQNLNLRSICDAGCGVGSLSIPLMEADARSIYASDISEKMVGEAQERAVKIFGNTPNLKFETKDLESISGKYNTVICLDVLIHYPTEDAAKMIAHLASLSEDRLILSFAPKTFWLTILKKIGEFFPGPSKTTRAYQHKEQDIRQILIDNGFAIARTEMTSTRFYYSRLLEAVRLR